MVQAAFVDLYGTVVHEMGPIAFEVARVPCECGTARSEREVLGVWWKDYRERLVHANGTDFRNQHDVALDSFRDMVQHFQAPVKAEDLVARMEVHWSTAPIYEEAAEFLEKMPVPVYFVTNSDDKYAFGVVSHYGLRPAGVITSEQARYYKPRPEIFRYALEKTGFRPEEVVYIGDSLNSDVLGPREVGMKAIWVNREGKEVPDGVTAVSNLMEIPDLLTSL